MAGTDHEERATALLGGGLLSERMRHGHDPFDDDTTEAQRSDAAPDVSLGPAAQIEIEEGQVRFLAPFVGRWPSEYWLRAFRQSQLAWPTHLVEPRIEEGRGLQLGPLPVGELEEHVRAAKERVEAANRIYVDEIEPELRRQHEEELRREREEGRLQAEVEAKLKYLLG